MGAVRVWVRRQPGSPGAPGSWRLVEAAGLLGLALGSDSRSRPGPALSGPVIAAIALWLIGFAVFVVGLGIGPALTLTRLEPGGRVLRLPTRLTVPIALILTALTGCSLAAAVVAGDATLANSAITVAVVLTVAGLASLTALVRSSRGMRALHSPRA
jgi:hypothetical protein